MDITSSRATRPLAAGRAAMTRKATRTAASNSLDEISRTILATYPKSQASWATTEARTQHIIATKRRSRAKVLVAASLASWAATSNSKTRTTTSNSSTIETAQHRMLAGRRIRREGTSTTASTQPRTQAMPITLKLILIIRVMEVLHAT